MILRVVQANIDNKNKGGAFLLIRNIHDILCRNEVTFDYITMDTFDDEQNYRNEMNTNTYSANLRKNRLTGHFRLPIYVYKTMKSCSYDIMHINSDSSWKALLFAVPAKLAGVNHIVIHSHSVGIDGDHKMIKTFLHKCCKIPLNIMHISCLACSEEAARWMYTKKNIEKCTVLFNGIDLEKYRFDIQTRVDTREKLGYSCNELVLGNVGLISKTKNQIYLIDILGEMHRRGINAKLLLVGDVTSEWRDKLLDRAKCYGVIDDLVIYGKSMEISKLMCAMDIYLLSSMFEGFCISLLEAQASGLPCVISDKIPLISTVTNWVKRCDIDGDASDWVEKIIMLNKKYNNGREERKVDKKYDLKNSEITLRRFYKKIVNEE